MQKIQFESQRLFRDVATMDQHVSDGANIPGRLKEECVCRAEPELVQMPSQATKGPCATNEFTLGSAGAGYLQNTTS